ncbi:unnamed protein product [Prorocentrum cordatum]|uniref:Uncharacterized protein n=1 Tax=Prorocentrum cordatum TaxID=2364126 RepID=A0ABN9R1X6_9DINO|nr:unnamed protein product [Polarella glacialis]
MTKMREAKKEGAPASWICKPCNAANSRIKRLCNTNEFIAEGIKKLSQDQRKSLIQKCHSLFDDALVKVVTEEAQQVPSQRCTSKSSMGGDMKLVRDVEKRLAAETDDEEKGALRMPPDKGVRHKCQYTGREWIWESSYAISKDQEEIQEQRQKRTIEQESKVKGKKLKRPAASKHEGDDDTEQTKPLRAAEKKKLEKPQTVFNEGMFELEKVISLGQNNSEVPEKVMIEANKVADDIRSERGRIEKALFDGMALPSIVKEILEGAEENKKQLSKKTSVLEAFVED